MVLPNIHPQLIHHSLKQGGCSGNSLNTTIITLKTKRQRTIRQYTYFLMYKNYTNRYNSLKYTCKHNPRKLPNTACIK